MIQDEWEPYQKYEYIPNDQLPNRTDFENKLARIEERQTNGKKEKKRAPKIDLFENNEWENREAFYNYYYEIDEKNKKESNLILVAKLIKNRYPNVDDGDRKTPFKQMGINQRREAVDLKLLLDECDRIIEFWPFLCIAEEQLREKRENEEWKYQRKLGQIKFELMGILDIEEGKGLDLIEILRIKKHNLSKMDKLINGLSLSTMRNEANEIKERVIRAKQLIEQATYMLVHVNSNMLVFNDEEKKDEDFKDEDAKNGEVKEGNKEKVEVKEEGVNYQKNEDYKEKFDGEEKGVLNEELKAEEKEELKGEKGEKHKKVKEELKGEKNNEQKEEK